MRNAILQIVHDYKISTKIHIIYLNKAKSFRCLRIFIELIIYQLIVLMLNPRGVYFIFASSNVKFIRLFIKKFVFV